MNSRVCAIIPPYLLARVAESGGRPADPCARTLDLDAPFRGSRGRGAPATTPPGAAAWTVHDAGNGTDLPGTPVRSAGEPETGDAAVDEAAHGVAASLALFAEVYGRDSYDGAGAPVQATVHYGQDYVNAFWNGTQLVFGDGDGEVFGRFTRPVDVLCHELTHAVTEHSAGLAYRDQSGALNESVSDVFAACLEQRLRGQGAAEADWLVGSDLFLPGVRARGLRDMRHPGTAYDDPRLGKDPQPDHMDHYVETDEDNGGVHINSGIPNRAFVLAATAIGGTSWEGAGRIWYAALTGGGVGPRTDFAGFAAATVDAAGEQGEAVRTAWADVGVDVEPATPRSAPSTPAAGDPGGQVVWVRRSGGFVARTVSGQVDLDSDDPRAARLRTLAARVDLQAVARRSGEDQPDRFVYRVVVCGTGPVDVPEQDLTDELSELVELVLGRGAGA